MQTLRYPVDSKPPFGLTLLLALQHLLAALGGIIAIPLVIGNVLKLPTPDTIVLVNAALLVSGIVTIIQCRGIGPIGLRLPSVIGTSFTFVAAALAIGFSEHGVAGILGASLVGSLIMVIGSFFMPYVRKLFPPVVTGVVVMMIGLSLIPVAVDWFAGGQKGDANDADPANLAMATFVLVLVVILVQWRKGIFSAAAIVIGMMVGYVVALAFGWISFEAVKNAEIVAIPQPLHFGLAFPISGIIGMSIAYLVTIVESSGNFLALGNSTQTEITGKHLRGGVLCDRFAMIIAAGIQMLDKVERSKRNGLIIAISIGCGLAVTTRPELLNKLPSFFKEVFGSGITVGSVLALVLNLILPEDKE
ncbi:solute carrier family 23 protein [Haemophilus parahaemolyticus]|jgi:Xanthine/uracil permeases|uniref:solute carrier family 23 protein n=1 Tax=Haemophilus parahaemolyticus TaxID=735 RepID=UPI00288AFFAC|nr:solute carrier family 23 protein [Haemophilus parahaemolyticus]